MRIVRWKDENTGVGRVAAGRVLLGCLLAAIGSAAVMGASVDDGWAGALQRVSYRPGENFVVLSLKNYSTIGATVRQESLSSGYGVVSKQIEAANAVPATEGQAEGKMFAELVTAEAACRTVGNFDACPGSMEMLHRKQQALALVGAMALPAIDEAKIVARRTDESARTSVQDEVAPIERRSTMSSAISVEQRPINSAVAAALMSQAACSTGGMFDACPGFLALLQSRQLPWPEFADANVAAADGLLTTGSLSKTIVASVSERLSVATETIGAVDRVAMRVGDAIMGAASTYNPYDRNDRDAGGAETASGELYNPIAWTAAIQTRLRGKFAGVRYGRLYKPSFALVELNGKRAIVKINDVGPLRPGRVIDLSHQVMHYFDPTLRKGVLDGMLVTPLVGNNWTPGPLGTPPVVAVASSL